MAKQLNFTHENGTEYPESYWKITKITLDIQKTEAEFILTGYKDLEARTQNKTPIGDRIVRLVGTDFAAMFAQVTEKNKNLQEAGYEVCLAVKDVSVIQDVVVDGKQEQQEIKVSFFEESIDVIEDDPKADANLAESELVTP